MSRRRFGQAEDTFKGFIRASDDHHTRRQQQMQAVQAMQAQQRLVQMQRQQGAMPAYLEASYQQGGGGYGASEAGPPAPPPASSPPHASDDARASTSTPISSHPSDSYDEQEEQLASALPVHAMDRDDDVVLAFGGSGGTGGGGYRGQGPPPLQEERASLLRPDQRQGGGSGGSGGGGGGGSSGDAAHWITRRNLDKIIQRKSIWIFVNGMFGLALMITILQVCWDADWMVERFAPTDISTAPPSYYADLEWVSERLQIQPEPFPTSWNWDAVAAQCPTPTRAAWTEGLKLLLTASSLLLCYQILDRERLQVYIKFREQRRKLRAKGFNQERDKLYMSSLLASANVSALGLLSLHPSRFRWQLWLQMLVCLIHPLPFTAQLTHNIIDDKIGMLMWLRIYLGFRVIRDCSEIWLSRRSIKHQSQFQTKIPDFDWWLSCKTISYRNPLFFAGCFYFISVIVFGHATYIAERDRLPRLFDFWISLFVSFQIVSIGWPQDVWTLYVPITTLGKMISILTGMAGLLLISFVIVTVGQSLYPSKFEENALLYISMDKVRQKERELSAQLIQFVWKNAQREAELAAKLAPINPALYEQIAEQEEKTFMDTFQARSKELRSLRRERAELEERQDPTSASNISPMDQYFDTKMEAIRTDIHQQAAKNNRQYMNVIATLNQLLHKISVKEKSKQQQQQQPGQQTAGGGGSGGAGAGVPSVGKKARKKAEEALQSSQVPAPALLSPSSSHGAAQPHAGGEGAPTVHSRGEVADSSSSPQAVEGEAPTAEHRTAEHAEGH